MKNNYKDITRLTKKKPLWWDEEGVPRYVKFHPSEVNNIYAREAVLFLIECQQCRTPFKVCLSADDIFKRSNIYRAIMDHKLHYGDPPNIGCCPAGATMNSEPIKVLEYWCRDYSCKWEEFTVMRNKLINEDPH